VVPPSAADRPSLFGWLNVAADRTPIEFDPVDEMPPSETAFLALSRALASEAGSVHAQGPWQETRLWRNANMLVLDPLRNKAPPSQT
jgi:hypothetical protein